jgi:hypothetical protein
MSDSYVLCGWFDNATALPDQYFTDLDEAKTAFDKTTSTSPPPVETTLWKRRGRTYDLVQDKYQ